MFDFENMDKKKRLLYRSMWGNERFDFPVEKTLLTAGKCSNNSYTFTGISTKDKNESCAKLIELFDIHNKDLFEKKFFQACDGDGKELNRIGRLHSSSLCALLFFYNVTKEHPLVLKLNGKICEFTYSRFEFQTPVIANPSNMDVVLVGREVRSGKAIILFLESKFSEYGEDVGKKLSCSAEYLDNVYSREIYEKNMQPLGFSLKHAPAQNEIAIYCDDTCYLKGIKQMISHYVGVNNFIKSGSITEDKDINQLKDHADIYLGEIVFDEGLGQFPLTKNITFFQSYRDKYEKLAEVLNGLGTLVQVVEKILTYSMFKKMEFIDEERIMKFYFEYGYNCEQGGEDNL